MRNLPNVNINDEEVRKSAMDADVKSGVSGKYEAEIVQASLEEVNGGSVFVTLGFKMPNGKIYRQEPKQVLKGEKDKFAEGFYLKILRSLFAVTNASDTVGTTTIEGGDFIDGQFVKRYVEVESYIVLLGKKVGVVLHYYQKYPDSLGINGYTGRPIPTKQEDAAGYESAKALATTIWMPNYAKDKMPVFDFVTFFDPATEKTFSEMTDDNLEKPVSVQKHLDEVIKKGSDAVIFDDKKWDDERIKRLKRNLKKNGIAYDPKQFIPTVGSGVNASDDDDSII